MYDKLNLAMSNLTCKNQMTLPFLGQIAYRFTFRCWRITQDITNYRWKVRAFSAHQREPKSPRKGPSKLQSFHLIFFFDLHLVVIWRVFVRELQCLLFLGLAWLDNLRRKRSLDCQSFQQARLCSRPEVQAEVQAEVGVFLCFMVCLHCLHVINFSIG